MERFLTWLPPRPKSVFIRYLTTTALVVLSLLAVWAVRERAGVLGFYLLFPAVFISSVLFDRGSGMYASLLSTALLYFMQLAPGALVPPRELILPLALFLLVALGVAVLSEGLRTAWERATAAERAKDILLRELSHRTKNSLAMVISLLTLQSRLKSNSEARSALEKAIARVRAIASAHDHVQAQMHSGKIEMRSYLEELCNHLGDSLREVRPVTIRVRAEEAYLPTEQAIPLGLIVNELVTNALKHAFPDEKGGSIEVVFSLGARPTLLVRDNGVGCSADTKEGAGSRLVRLLAEQLGGTMRRTPQNPGCSVHVELPVRQDPSLPAENRTPS
jgi:two-component system, sensor histidine kinase PdtaS